MKKQIAVLMAAATAVTTVAPALAHADVNDQENVVVSTIVDQVANALKTTYKNKNANGITLPTGSTLTQDYLNSRYIVLVSVNNGSNVPQNMEKAGFAPLNESAYAQFRNYYIGVDGGVLNPVEAASVNDNVQPSPANYYVVDDAVKLQTILEKYGKKAMVQIVDKGDINGASYRTTTSKHYVLGEVKDADTQVSLNTALQTLLAISKQSDTDQRATMIDKVEVETYNVDRNNNNAIINTGFNKEMTLVSNSKVDTTKVSKSQNNPYTLVNGTALNNVARITVKLTSGEKIVLEQNSDVLDFAKAFTKNKQEIKLFKDESVEKTIANFIEGANKQDVLDQIVNFGTIANENDKSVDVMAIEGNTDVYTVSEETPEAIQLKNIYTREGGYTQAGADFVNSIIDARMGKNNYSFNYNGTLYQLDGAIDFSKAFIKTVADGYQLVVPVKVRNANDLPLDYTLRFEITGASQTDLFDILRDLQGSVNVVPGHFTKLAGTNRYGTAIAVSQKQFDPETADSVVIVGGYAQMDGLAAAPLAAAKNAPILLADPHNGLSKDTLNEIKRACKNLQNRTVYIVGGLNSVPAVVEKQLKENFGAVVLRQAGTDRNATSLAVARRLFYDGQTNGNVFVVGRDGGADAMGVASVASNVNVLKYVSDQESKQAAAQQNVPATSSVSANKSVITTEDKISNTIKVEPAADFAKTTLARMVSFGVLAPVNRKEAASINSRTAYENFLKDKNLLNEKSKTDYEKLYDYFKVMDTHYYGMHVVTILGKQYLVTPEILKLNAEDQNKLGAIIGGLFNDAKVKEEALREALRVDALYNSPGSEEGTKEYYKNQKSKASADVKTAEDALTAAKVKVKEDHARAEITAKKQLTDKIAELEKTLKEKSDAIKENTVKTDADTTYTAVLAAQDKKVNGANLEELNKLFTTDTPVNKDGKNDAEKKLTQPQVDYILAKLAVDANANDIKAKNEEIKAKEAEVKDSDIDANADVKEAKKNLVDAKSAYNDIVNRENAIKAQIKSEKLLLEELNKNQTKLNNVSDIYRSAMSNLEATTDLNGRTVSPILVVNKNGMSRVTRDFIQFGLKKAVLSDENNGTLQAYIIGGENSVSTNVRKDLAVAVQSENVTRLAGANRYATNVAVINNFYTNGTNLNVISGTKVLPTNKILVKGAVFTSGADQYLVDSQTAGSFAAEKKAPIVLTDKTLTSNQVDLMKKNGVLYEQRSGIYQVGGVVSADVMKNVVQLLGL